MSRRLSVVTIVAALATPGTALAQGAPLSALHWRSVGPYIGGRVAAVTGVRG